jgi:hypothetical protein
MACRGVLSQGAMEQALAASVTAAWRPRAPHYLMGARIDAANAMLFLAKAEANEVEPSIEARASAEPNLSKSPAVQKAVADAVRSILERVDTLLGPMFRNIVASNSVESLEADAESDGWNDLEGLATLRDKLRGNVASRAELVKAIAQVQALAPEVRNENLEATLRAQAEWTTAVLALIDKRRKIAIDRLRADVIEQAAEVEQEAEAWSAVDSDGWG